MIIGIHFTHEPITIPDAVYPNREIGAVVEFHGVVREIESASPITGLHYEAYTPMAEKVLERHLVELGSIHRCDAVHFIHRLGWVPVGEASLYIRVMSSHRLEALRLLTYAIDRLKLDVPIWKLPPKQDDGTEQKSPDAAESQPGGNR